MNSNQNLLNLGRALKERREELGLTLKEAEGKTKISIQTLQDIEEARADRLPVYAYLRGFILAYAKVLAMDEKKMEQEVKALAPLEDSAVLSKVAPFSSETENLIEKDLRLTPVILAISILFVLGGILVFGNIIGSYKEKSVGNISAEDFYMEEAEEGKDPAPPAKDREGKNKDKALPAEGPQGKDREREGGASATAPAGDEKTSFSLELIVKALGDVKVLYRVDREKKKELHLKKNQFEVLKGLENIFIQTKDSDLIYIFHNGKNLGLFGDGGHKEQTFTATN